MHVDMLVDLSRLLNQLSRALIALAMWLDKEELRPRVNERK